MTSFQNEKRVNKGGMMPKACLSCTLIVMLFMLSSCKSIGLKEHIFMGNPAWEDAELLQLVQFTDANRNQVALHQNTVGLGNLVKQTLGQEEFAYFNKERFKTSMADSYVVIENNPLPPDIANNAVAKAMVLTIFRETQMILGASDKALAGKNFHDSEEFQKLISERRLPNKNLTDDDFKHLANELARNFWPPKQKVVASTPTHGFSMEESRKSSWTEIFVAYMMEYYNGKYIDRYGVEYEKPKLSFKITNDAIVALANIFQESLWDYAFLSLHEDIKDPVIYRVDAKDSFLNGSGKTPTFAKFLRVKSETDKIAGLVEPVRTDDRAEGLGKRDVCVVHYFSGLSGESSEAVSGMFVKSLGGFNVGFVAAYGKWSIGDNETLTKLIDASVETFSKRSADLLFSTILYRSGPNKVSWQSNEKTKTAWDWIEKHIKIAELLKCFDEEGN